MHIDPAVLEIASAYGPIVASIVGSILSVLLATILWLGRRTWLQYEEKLNNTANLVIKLTDAISSTKKVNDEDIRKMKDAVTLETKDITKLICESREKNNKDHEEMWEFIQQLRGELAMHVRTNEMTSKAVNSLEGVLSVHHNDFKSLEKIANKLDGKVDAIFRFVDANRRATDT